MGVSPKFGQRLMVLPERLALGDAAIEATNVGVAIEGKAILAGVQLTVRAGEILALVGPNGAGKSTLLGAISGDQAATGSIAIAGTDIADWRVGDLARRRAVLAQQNTVAFPFTVLEVVEMGRAPWWRTPLEDEDDLAVREALEETEVTRFAERHFPSLSGGERARVSLARVLAQRTGILLLDEPTAALDIKHQEAVLRVARRRADLGDAVVVVLHDLNLAAAHADRVTLLAEGAVHSHGAPEEVLTAKAISAVYQHPVEIVRHPVTGAPIVLPLRNR